MSYSLSTSQVETNLGQNHFGSVAVSSVGVSAELAHKNSFRAFKSLLGSRRTTRTRHRCVSGRHNHHRSARPLGVSNQFAFRLADSIVGSLTRHRGLEQELGTEVLHRDHLVTRDDFTSPLPSRVLALPGDFLVEFRGLFLRGRVTVRSCFAGFGFTPGYAALIFREPRRGGLRVLGSLEVELGIRRGRDSGHTPVDPHHGVNLGQRHLIDSYNETRVPVAETVLEHSDAAWFAGKFTRPHHRDADAAGEAQPAILDAESVTGVLQGREVPLLFKRPPARPRERAHCLLLDVLRTCPQPFQFLAGNSQIGTLKKWSTFFTGRNHLVPQPAASVPFGVQHAGRLRAGTQPVVVAKRRRCSHRTNIFDRSDIPGRHTREAQLPAGALTSPRLKLGAPRAVFG